MKQIKIITAYLITEELAKNELTLNGKWTLYKVRKSLLPQYEFYMDESKNLFSKYETTQEGTSVKFETVELANEYKEKQAEIDNFEVDTEFIKQECKLSDIPNITIQQMEALEDFIEFIPE